jgi:hypothetical protein
MAGISWNIEPISLAVGHVFELTGGRSKEFILKEVDVL